MYFHPLILTDAQKQQRAAAYQDDARRWLDDIDREHRPHTEAVCEVLVRQHDGLWVASDSIDLTLAAVRCRARVDPARLAMLQASARAIEIVADCHLNIIASMDLGAKIPSRSVVRRKGRDALPPTDVREPAFRGKERA